MFFQRILSDALISSLRRNPVTAIIGARQVGKSTLAKALLSQQNQPMLYIDLEKPSDRLLLSEPEDFFNLHKGKCICLDEIQLLPEVFPVIRSFVDEHKDSKFLVLGSSSPHLLRQTSETLAGRIAYFELKPFLFSEVSSKVTLENYRLLGGFPRSILSQNSEEAFEWLNNFITTFLERNLRMFGYTIPSETLHRLWLMLAHLNGQICNYSQLGNSMGLSHTTIKHYIDILHHTFMIRLLPPYFINTKKRLIKSPKLYLRDTGILHALLNITSNDELFKHPVYGNSWEITVIENVLEKYKTWSHYYYRTAKGVEVDLVLTKANRIMAIEIKSSSTPKLSLGFWNAMDDIGVTEAYVIAPVKMPYPLKKGVMVYNLEDFIAQQ